MGRTIYRYVGDPVDDILSEFDEFGCPRRRRRAEEFDCCVKVENKIDIKQEADAKGGDGGDGGDNNSAAAAAATSGGVAVSVPVTVDVEEENLFKPFANNGADGEDAIEAAQDNMAKPNGSGGTEAEANAGNGGNGGDAEVKQSAYAKIDNWTVIVCGDDGSREWIRNLRVESDEDTIDLKVEEDGIFLNGEKMKVKELKDGSKVFILKQSSKK